MWDKIPVDSESEFAGNKLNLVRLYLTNVRVIAGLLVHVFYNQVKMLIQSRVVYDRELFNFEDYTCRCLSDGRLISKLFFADAQHVKMACGKYLMSEFFKFQ